MTILTTPALRVPAIIFFCSIAVLLLVHYSPAQAAGPDPRQHGAAIFQTAGCERCHSITGVGGDRAPDLGAVGKHHSSDSIKKQIIKGGHGMPPFGEVLKASEVDDLVAFLESCRSKTPPGCRQWTPATPAPAAQ